MKLKFTYRPQQSLLLKKIISKSLAIGLVLNSGLASFAGILSEDGRYETFKDNYITIDNILEEDKVDIEVEGNSLVNLADMKSSFEIRNLNYYYKDFTICDTSKLKLNTEYTLFIYKELLDNHNENFNYLELGLGDTLDNMIAHPAIETDDNYQNKYSFKFKKSDSNEILKIKIKFTDFKNYKYLAIRPMRRYSAPVTNENCNANVKILFLEGDYSSFDIPYFEGIKSVGEKDNANEINIISNNQNLFDINNTTNQYLSYEGNNLLNADVQNKTSDFIKIEPNSFYLYNVENFTDTHGLWTGYAFYREKDINSVINSRVVINSLNDVVIKAPEDANYIRIGSRYLQQEGVKVYFQKLNSNYSSDNKNLFDINNATNQFIVGGGTTLSNADYENKTSDFIKIEPNTLYLYNVENFINTNGLWTGYAFYREKDMNSVINDRITANSLTDVMIKTPKDANYIRIGSRYLQQEGVKVELRKVADLSNFKYEELTQDTKNIVLNEPLRSLPSGTKDRIIKRNGQWVVERNISVKKLDKNFTDIRFIDDRFQTENTIAISIALPDRAIAKTKENNNPILSDKLLTHEYSSILYSDTLEGLFSDASYKNIYCRLLKSNLSSYDKAGIIDYFTNNPTVILYELENPIYESLNTDLFIPLYINKTYIFNNSIIPCNIKIIVDRVLNRAIEAVDLAKSNPTIENISKARMWTNLIKESIKKDELQGEINDINKTDDLLQLEKKNITSSVDIYIKPANILSVNLNTNSISFEDFSIAQDIEQLSAVKITVESSLPYNLSAYLESEIQNSDKTKTIDKSILNIKSSDKTEYKAFVDLKTPILLADNQDINGTTVHEIDIKLSGNTSYEVDVYKTVIKFEVEQK